MDINALEDPVVRIGAMEDNFPLFFAYHFGRKFTEFQKERMRSMESDKNTMIIAFRASRKTTIVRGYIVRCICYKKEPSIVWQSYEQTLSAESVREIAKMLCKDSIVEDYGMLFPFDSKREEMAKKSLSNFETTNGVKVISKASGQTLRGANTYDMKEEISARPSLLVLDDIDVFDSVNNVQIINKNESKIKGETIGALDPLRSKIIFLGNIINEDGVVPRFWNNYKKASTWNCYKQALFDEEGNNVRPEVFTDEVIEKLKEQGKTSWNQNYMLIPSIAGSGVFTRDYFDYYIPSHFELADGILKKEDLNVGLFVDPAFSANQRSDDAVVVLGGKHKITKHTYLIDGYAATSAPSKTIQALIVMYNKAVMDGYTPSFVSVEDVSINREQKKFIELLREELLRREINIPVYLYTSRTNKEDRIKFNLEARMSQRGIKFNRNISQTDFITTMEKQFLDYPNGDKDDIIDTVSQMEEVFAKRFGETKQKQQEVAPPRSAITGREIQPRAGRFSPPTKSYGNFSAITGRRI